MVLTSALLGMLAVSSLLQKFDMPIISRTIDHITTYQDSSVCVNETHTDAKSRQIAFRGAGASDIAAAETQMNARDLTSELVSLDYAALSKWVRDKNNSDDFDFTDNDLTLLEGEERLLIEFAEGLGSQVIDLAWWIEDMNPPTYKAIADRVGLDADTRARVQDRAVLLNAAEPVFDQVEII